MTKRVDEPTPTYASIEQALKSVFLLGTIDLLLGNGTRLTVAGAERLEPFVWSVATVDGRTLRLERHGDDRAAIVFDGGSRAKIAAAHLVSA